MKRRQGSQVLLNSPYITWSVLFIIVPLIFIAYYSFTDSNGSFTLNNFSEFFSAGDYMQVFGKSALYAFWATLICLIIGYPFAYCMTKINANRQRMMMLLVMLPMLMSLIVRTYSWQQILERNGIINNLLDALGFDRVVFLGKNPGIIIFGMVYNYLPFMILPIYSVISKVSPSLLEASQDLGCNSFNTIRRIILPMSIPGILSGITMVFVPCISTFYISKAFSNGMIKMIGDTIEYEFINSSNPNFNIGATISFVLMVIILISLAIVNHFSDEEIDSGGVVI